MQHNRFKVTGEEVFSVDAPLFGIAATAAGYTLQWSSDGVTYNNLDTVSANTNKLITNNSPLFYYKLSGNGSTTEVTISY